MSSIIRSLNRFNLRYQFRQNYNTSLSPILNSTTNFRKYTYMSCQNLVWIDLEMTGLDVDKDRILEIACIITDSKLNIVAKGPNLIIKEPDSVLENMDDWCMLHHAKSGLINAVKLSKINLQQAETEVLDFVKQHCPEKQCPMAGNSIYMDRAFLRKYMPLLDAYMHYRVVDVSTIKELCKRWNIKIYNSAPPKRFAHRGLEDIEDSINEMKYYKDTFFTETQ